MRVRCANCDDDAFFKRLFSILPDMSSHRLILGGDFNCVLEQMDIENGTGFNQKKCQQLSDLVATKNLQDIFRHMHPRTKEFTFFRTNCAPSRLDRFYLSGETLKEVNLNENKGN